MKELEKQYNKDVKNPANFSLDRRSYMTGGRVALEWVGSMLWLASGQVADEVKERIKEELGDI